ncbi:hypothetical protein QO004_002777 [Rhizobium mesoamericanum]|nr:hypothetical protein [Rhizobium mesoamericanum]
MRLRFAVPAINNKLVNIVGFQSVIRQNIDDSIEVVDILISRVVFALLLFDGENQPTIL